MSISRAIRVNKTEVSDMPKSILRRKLRKITLKHSSTRPTPEDKSKYLHEIIKNYKAGLTTSQIARKLGISEASIYRWQRQADDIQRAINVRSTDHKIVIEDAISALLSPRELPKSRKVEALFQFLTWLQWPSDPGYHAAAMINCLCSYQIQSFNVKYIDDIENDWREIVLKYLTVDVARRFSSPQAGFNPDFEVVSDAATYYDDRQFFAQVIAYLISRKFAAKRRPHKPTLDTLQTLVEEGAFGRGWSMTARTFEKFWRARAATFPFFYIEHYHSTLDWSINPQDADFAQIVEEIIENLEVFPLYISQVRWVITRMQEVLDPRASRRIAFPPLPEKIDPIAAEPPTLDPDIQEMVKALF